MWMIVKVTPTVELDTQPSIIQEVLEIYHLRIYMFVFGTNIFQENVEIDPLRTAASV